jgi:ferritin
MTEPAQLYDEAFFSERTLFIRTLLGHADEVNRNYAEMIVAQFPECRELNEEIKDLLAYANRLVQFEGLSPELRKRLSDEVIFERDELTEKKLKVLVKEQIEEFQDHQEIFKYLQTILKNL